MKIRTILITTVVVAGITGGVGYGAYRAMKGQAKPVDVVPVRNVNQMYYGESGSLYGTVTSQVAQTVTLNDEYEIEEIYVQPGDTVKEGTPLFSYDMTLPELELEMDKLTLQMYEIDKTRMEKELEKLRGTRATASLELNDSTMTAAGEGNQEEAVIAEPESSGEPAPEDEDETGEPEPEKAENPGLSIINVEKVEDPSAGEDSTEPAKDGDKLPAGTQKDGNEQETSSEAGTEKSEKTPSKSGTTEAETVEKFLKLAGQLEEIFGTGRQDKTDITGEECAELLSEALSCRDTMADCQDDGTYKLKARFQRNLIREWSKNTGESAAQTKASADDKEPDESEYKEELEEIYDAIETVGDCHVEYAAAMAGALEEMDAADAAYETQIRAAQKACSSLNAAQKKLDVMAEPFRILEAAEKKLKDQQLKDEMETMILQFENLILSLDTLYRDHADSIVSGDIEKPVSQALESFWGKLAREEDGGYVWKDEVESCFKEDKEVLEGLKHYADKLLGARTEGGETVEGYQTRYVRLLLEEWDSQKTDAKEKAEQLLASYNRLFQHQKELLVTYGEKLQAAGALAQGGETEPGSETEPESHPESESETESESTGVTELPEETEMQSDPLDITAYISQFRTLAEVTEEKETYLEDWGNAIDLFQQRLGELPMAFAGEETSTMDQYQLKSAVAEDESLPTEGLEEEYKALCLKYVNAKILLIDTALLDPTNAEDYDAAYAAFEDAAETYMKLGETWAQEIQVSYILDACNTILLINAVDESMEESDVAAAIQAAWESYEALPEEGKMLVWNLPLLQELMDKYGITPNSESEPMTGDFGDGGWDDWGGWDDPGEGYTAEELQEMIADLESELKENDLEIREAELQVKQQQRVVDGKVVRSTLNGTVLSIGAIDGSTDDEYFARVASTQGLYAIGSMNELSLEKIKVGDVISGTLDETGVSFTGTIKEIAEYPSAGESYSFGWGNENTNASYYEFKALIEDDSELSEGSAEIQLSDTVEDYSNKIYLENYFIRTESDGRAYVMKQGENGRLTKQYVETGQTIYGYATEVVQGVTLQDKLAFPYGNSVVEGAETKEVDQLEYS